MSTGECWTKSITKHSNQKRRSSLIQVNVQVYHIFICIFGVIPEVRWTCRRNQNMRSILVKNEIDRINSFNSYVIFIENKINFGTKSVNISESVLVAAVAFVAWYDLFDAKTTKRFVSAAPIQDLGICWEFSTRLALSIWNSDFVLGQYYYSLTCCCSQFHVHLVIFVQWER